MEHGFVPATRVEPPAPGSNKAAGPRQQNTRSKGTPPKAPRVMPIQAKLAVGAVDDPLEREADIVARQVMDRLGSGAGGGKIRRSTAQTVAVPPRPADTKIRAKVAGEELVVRRLFGKKKGFVELEGDSEGGGGDEGYQSLDEEEEPVDPALAEAAELVAEADPALIKKVAGAFSTYSAKKSGQKGRVSGSGEIEASVGAGAEFTLTKEGSDLLTGIKYIAAASAKAGVEFKASGEIGVDLGPAQLKAAANLRAFAGVAAEATGSVELSLISGFLFEGSISAMAGAEVTAEGNISFDLGQMGVEAEGWGRLFAGAEASAEGSISLTRKGLSISGKVEAFAGVKAEAKASVSFKFRGRPIIKLSGKASALAGVGGEAEGEFTISGGKLVISGSIAGALGIGGELGAGLEIDFEALAMGIYETAQAVLGEQHPYKKFLDPSDTIRPLNKELTRYKAAQEKKRKPLEATMVQKIIEKALKAAKQDKSPEFDLLDRFLNEGLAETLGANGTMFSWQLTYTRLRSFQQHNR